MDSSLKPKELCLIIKTCQECNVSNLTLKDIAIEFFASDSEKPSELPQVGPSQVTPTNEEVGSQQPLDLQMYPEDQEILKEELHAQLLIDDPVGFEEQMMSEQLAAANTEVENDGSKDYRSGEDLY